MQARPCSRAHLRTLLPLFLFPLLLLSSLPLTMCAPGPSLVTPGLEGCCGDVNGGGHTDRAERENPPIMSAHLRLIRKQISEDVEPLAICMDGSRASFFDDEKAGATCLVIFFQKGGLCTTFEDCADEEESSNDLPETIPARSLLSSDAHENPHLWFCRHIYVPYCSKDLYSGDGIATNGSSVLHFRGHRIINGLFNTLAADLPDFGKVVLAGASAGAIGLTVQIRRILATWWPDTATAARTVLFLSDSGWLTDVTPPTSERSPGSLTLIPELLQGISFWNSTATLASMCTLSPLTSCFRQEFVSALIPCPALYLVSAFDGLYLDTLGSVDAEISQLLTYFLTQGGTMRLSALNAKLNWPESHIGRSHIVLASCTQHTFYFPGPEDRKSAGDAFGDADLQMPEMRLRIFLAAENAPFIKLGNISLLESDRSLRYDTLIGAWLKGAGSGSSARISLVGDECQGFSCNPTCPFDVLTKFPAVEDRSKTDSALVAWFAAVAVLAGMIILPAVSCVYAWCIFRKLKAAVSKPPSKDSSQELGIFYLLPSERVNITFANLCYWAEPVSARELDLRIDSARDAVDGSAIDLAQDRHMLLKDVSGRFVAGSLTAIMGPSGCGKTTLMDVVSRRRNFGTSSGEVQIQGVGSSASPKSVISYVENEDDFLDNLTVRETILFRMMLHGSRAATSEKLKAERDLFWAVLCELGLEGAADVPMKTCSSGQRRRVSVALSILLEKPVLLLDEPTSGLDATSALQLVKVLRSIALSGRCVVLSIHQPRNEILSLIDCLIVMRSGEMVHNGSIEDAVKNFKVVGSDIGSSILDSLYVAPGQELLQLVQHCRRETRVTGAEEQKSVRMHQAIKVASAESQCASQRRMSTLERAMKTQRSFILVLGALILRNFTQDKRGFKRLLLYLAIGNSVIAAVFPNFTISDKLDAVIFATIVTLSLLINRFLVEQRTSITLQGSLDVHLREIRQDVFSPLHHILAVWTRDAPLTALLVTPCYAIVYFGVGLSEPSPLRFFATTMLVCICCLVSSHVIAGFFHMGLSHRVTVSLIQIYKILEAFLSGVLVPIKYLPVWLSWIRYITVTFHATRVIVFLNLIGSTYKCDEKILLDTGADGCYQTTPNFSLLAAGFDESGADVVTNIFVLLAISVFWYAYCVLILNRRLRSTIVHHNRRIILLNDGSSCTPETEDNIASSRSSRSSSILLESFSLLPNAPPLEAESELVQGVSMYAHRKATVEAHFKARIGKIMRTITEAHHAHAQQEPEVQQERPRASVRLVQEGGKALRVFECEC